MPPTHSRDKTRGCRPLCVHGKLFRVGWKGQARPSACRGHMGRGIDGSLHYLSLTTTGKVGPALHSALWSWGLSLGACYSGLTWDFVPCRFSFPSGIPTAAAAQPACPCGEEVGGGRPPPPAGTPLLTAAWEPLPLSLFALGSLALSPVCPVMGLSSLGVSHSLSFWVGRSPHNH